MELPARVREEPGQVAEALGVPEADHGAFVVDSPVLAFLAKRVPRNRWGADGNGGPLRGHRPACLNRSERLDPLADCGHPEGAGGGKPPIQQPERPASVSSLAA